MWLTLLFLLTSLIANAQCTTNNLGVCVTGLTAAQDRILGPLTPINSSPWSYGDQIGVGVTPNMVPAALAEAPALGTQCPGTVSWTSGTQTVTTTADTRACLSGQGWTVFTWNSVDGVGTGRALCPIQSVSATTITCAENLLQPTSSGIAVYKLPPPDTHGFDFQTWTTENPSTGWNYYGVDIALYRLWIRTGNTQYLSWARQYADITWQWTLDHGYRSVAPRASNMLGQFFRASEGHPERLPGLYNWIVGIENSRWLSPALAPAIDNREAGYELWANANGAKVDTDPTRHAAYCSALTTAVTQWNSVQAPDGSFPENEFALNSAFVSAPKTFTAPFLYQGAPWRQAIIIKGLEASHESLNDTSSQGCNNTGLASTLLNTIANAVTWQWNYGRDTGNRGIYYVVNSQSDDQQTVTATGTVSITRGSTVLVGVGTNWQTAGYCDGTHFPGFYNSATVYKIASCSDNTHATLTVAFGLYGETADLVNSGFGVAPAATSSCNSLASYCGAVASNTNPGDRNLTRTVAGDVGWLYGQTLNTTYKTWADEFLSAQLGGPTSGLTSAANIGSTTLPCSGPVCDGLVTDTVAAAANCSTQPSPCVFGSFLYSNLGKNFGEAFGAPSIDSALAYRLFTSGPPTTGTCDLNNDGKVNILDVQLQVNQTTGVSPCTNKLDGTNSCTVVSIQRVVNASFGGPCVIDPPPATTTSDEEFVGPFPSWTNLTTVYGSTSTAIQNAFNDVGTPGHNHNLWIPCGTYSTPGLTITSREGISILGGDPTCVTFQLTPGSNGPILTLNGVDYSRISRITFDGGGNTNAIAIKQANTSGAFFDTGNEYADDVFKNVGSGIQCGWMVNGCSEISILRDHFSNISGPCVFTGNFNALDLWVRYSVFDHCGTGVGNYDGTNVGAGNFHVYNSIFRHSTVADINIANTTPFSFRDNYFIGSPYAVWGAGTGNPAPMTIAGNTFIDQTQQVILMQNQGPVLLMDNVARQASSTLPAANISSDGVAVNNIFTLGPNPIAASNRLFESGTQIVSSGSINAAEPTLPGVQPIMNRTVFEVAPGATTATIQTTINNAGAQIGNRPIVHIPEGPFNISSPLSFPANSDIQLVCDGEFATKLNWTGVSGGGPVILITGPSHVTVRECGINAGLGADGIGAYNIDQAGSRVFLHGVQTGADNLAANTNIFYNGLDNTVLDIEDTGHSGSTGTGVKVVGGPLAAGGNPAGGMVRYFSGSGGNEALPYQVNTGGTLLLRDYWNESQGPAFANISGRAQVTFDGVHAFLSSNTGQTTPGISISGLIGKVSILTSNPQDRTIISGNGSQTSVLQAGGDQDCQVISPYFIDNTSPAGTSGLLIHRECTTTVPGTGSIPTANIGSADPTFVTSMLAQTRAAHQAPLTTLSAAITDLRLYRVSVNRGVNGIHLTTVRTNLH